eukprot:Lithocolla_globosa_v1_NODE_1640_length_2430_cov_8.270737.p1 type:complete len:502 gc:universal NODE_1640_length_2430_cov_8.270737:127-1632(+)
MTSRSENPWAHHLNYGDAVGTGGPPGPPKLSRLMFEKYDKEGEGFINFESFKQLCYDLGYFLSDQELELGLKYLDKTGNGKLGYPEFSEWWSETNREEYLKLDSENLAQRVAASETFQAFDEQGNGFLKSDDVEAFFVFCSIKGLCSPDIEDSAQFMREIDQNEDGKIQFKEYIDWLERKSLLSPSKPSTATIVSAKRLAAKPASVRMQHITTARRMTGLKASDKKFLYASTRKPGVNPFKYPSADLERFKVTTKKFNDQYQALCKQQYQEKEKLQETRMKEYQKMKSNHQRESAKLEETTKKEHKVKTGDFLRDYNKLKREAKKSNKPISEQDSQADYKDFLETLQAEKEDQEIELKNKQHQFIWQAGLDYVQQRRKMEMEHLQTLFALETKLLDMELSVELEKLMKNQESDMKKERKAFEAELKEQEKKRKKSNQFMPVEERIQALEDFETEQKEKAEKDIDNFKASSSKRKEELQVKQHEYQKSLTEYYDGEEERFAE